MPGQGPGNPTEPNAANGQGAQEKAKEKAQEVTGRAQSMLRDQVGQRSTQIGEQIHQNTGAVRSVATSLRDEGQETPARYAEQAADRADRIGDWLQRADGDEIIGDVEEFARRNPWAVAAAAAAIGFAASRMLKASSSRRYGALHGT
jgi:ElaB/YqjD/DUF883 family membrane-anchored ribosome-binding protein/uncharacterized protein YjbJ (UPF0337 family)